VLFAAGPAGSESNFNEARIEVQSLETGEHHVISRGTYPRYASSGHLLYVDNDTILARRFDVKALAAVGASVPVLEHVDAGAAGQKPFDISVNGTVAYAPGLPELPQPLFVVDVTGAMRPLPFAPARFRQPRVSPDGQHLVVGVVATDADLWVYDITNGARTRITSGGSNRAATWTHDGRRVIYAATRSATTSIYRRSADASTPEEKLISIGALPQSVSLSPDDHTLLFNTPNDTTGATSFRVDLTDAQHPRQWVNSPSGEEFITVSPDGERVAYVSNQSGRPEVYVRPSSDKGGGVQVSIATGRAPVWAHGGRELFFLDSQRGLLMAARVTSKPILTVGVPRRIMSSGSAANLDIDAYDVMPDDRHFVIVRNNANSQHELSIITNWTEELKARVPTK
jgi:serine/threonine-protein kinase